ncbi:hypothetical protein Tco_0571062, partial [Tanacetum coccineum]
MLESQITDKSKKGIGYHPVVPPHPLSLNAPTKLDLSYSGLEEFQQPEFEGYRLRANKSVYENSSNEPKKYYDAPLIEEWVSDNKDEVESPIVVEKKTVVPTIPKVEVARPKQQEKSVRKTVRYAEMYRQVNTARPKAVVNAVRINQVKAGNLETKLEDSVSYALTKKPKVFISFIKQFWNITEASTNTDGEVTIIATIDGQSKTITEASLRRHLKLEDHDVITSIPNSEIFEQLALMGYPADSDKLTFQKGIFSPQWRFLIHTILYCLSPKKTAWEQFSSNIATALICLATNRKYNFSRLIFDHMVTNIGSPHKFLMYPRFIQICLDMQKKQLQTHTRTYPVPSLNNKVFSNMRRPTKGYTGVEVELFHAMITIPTPETSPTPLSSPSRITSSPSQTSETQPSPAAEDPVPSPNESPLHVVHSHRSDEGRLKLNELTNLVTKLSERIGVLEDDLKNTKQTYKDEEDDSSKQGRKISDIDEDFNTYFAQDDEVVHDQDTAKEGQPEDSITGITVSTAPINISTARETRSTAV